MKITKTQLKQIITEELERVLNEADEWHGGKYGSGGYQQQSGLGAGLGGLLDMFRKKKGRSAMKPAEYGPGDIQRDLAKVQLEMEIDDAKIKSIVAAIAQNPELGEKLKEVAKRIGRLDYELADKEKKGSEGGGMGAPRSARQHTAKRKKELSGEFFKELSAATPRADVREHKNKQ